MTSRVPFWEPVFGEREKQLIAEILDSGFINDGDATVELERRIAELCGVPYAVAVTSGTAAIFLALAAQGIGPGDEVIVPDVTFIATANAVTLAGARPVLVDIEPETLCLDPSCTDAAVTSRTKAIVPVHISGRAANMPALKAIAKRHGLAIVEDAAHALGSHAFGAALGERGDGRIDDHVAAQLPLDGAAADRAISQTQMDMLGVRAAVELIDTGVGGAAERRSDREIRSTHAAVDDVSAPDPGR